MMRTGRLVQANNNQFLQPSYAEYYHLSNSRRHQVPFLLAIGQKQTGRMLPGPINFDFSCNIQMVRSDFGLRSVYLIS